MPLRVQQSTALLTTSGRMPALLERFQFVRTLSETIFGSVSLAFDTLSKRLVVVKHSDLSHRPVGA